MNPVSCCGVVLALTSLAIAQPTDQSNISCVKELTIPFYPTIAKAARVQGVIIATATVTQGGLVEKVVTTGHAMLATVVLEAVKSAKYDRACGGKIVSIRFSFELLDESHPDSRGLEDFIWRAPNTFVIGTPPMMLNF